MIVSKTLDLWRRNSSYFRHIGLKKNNINLSLLSYNIIVTNNNNNNNIK